MQNPYLTKKTGSNSGTTETSLSLSSIIAKNSGTKNACHVEKRAATKEDTSKKRPNARQKINNNRAQLKKEIELLKEMKRQKLLSIDKSRDEGDVVKSIITPTPNKNSISNPTASSKITPHATIINLAANPATKRRNSHPYGQEGKENMIISFPATSKENRRDDTKKVDKIYVNETPDEQTQNKDFLLLKKETGDQNNDLATYPQIMSNSTNLIAIPDTSWISPSASDNKKQHKPIVSIPVSSTETRVNDTNKRSSDSFITTTQNPDGTPQDNMDPLLVQEEAMTTISQITPNAAKNNQVEIHNTEWNSTTSWVDKDSNISTRENHLNAPTILLPKEEKNGDCGVLHESNAFSCYSLPGIWSNPALLSPTMQNYYYCNNWFPNNYYNNYCYYSNHYYPTHFPQPYPMITDIPLSRPQPPPQLVSYQAEATASDPFYNNRIPSNIAHRPPSMGTSYPWPYSQRKLVKQKQLKPLYLSTKPVDFPSPWSKTHSVVSTAITICKPGVNINDSSKKSYGIEVKFDSKYNFFAPETTPAIKEPQGTDESSASELHLTAAEAPKVPRKRRQTYGVVRVTDPGRQSPLLKENDIILSIQGVDVGQPDVSHTFSQVLSLLGNGDSGKDIVQCQLTIARAKSVKVISKVIVEEKSGLSVAMPKIPFIVEQKKIISGEFCEEEMMALFRRFQTTNSWDEEPKGETCLNQRETSTLHSRWLYAIHEYEEEMQTKASSFWKKVWLEEEAIASSSDSPVAAHYITDAVRSKMRGYPRPVFGCKCGSITHQRVSEDGCILYRNTRLLPPVLWGDEGPNNNMSSRNAPKPKTGKSVVDAALGRIQRIQQEIDADEKEAEFVNEMELRQVRNGSAIFAPSLPVMVVSAIAAIVDKKQQEKHNARDYDDDDDDVPLAKVSVMQLTIATLAEIALYISRTWGSVYLEPSHSQFEWRCKMHELITGKVYAKCGIAPPSQSPREPGCYSFENLRFFLDGDDTKKRLQDFKWEIDVEDKDADMRKGPPMAGILSAGEKIVSSRVDAVSQKTRDTGMLTYLLSSWKTGLIDEVVSLCDAGILEKCRVGGAGFRLKNNWPSRVDPLFLDEMHEKWGQDIGNKYCIHLSIREQVERTWERTVEGWVRDKRLMFSHEDLKAERTVFF